MAAGWVWLSFGIWKRIFSFCHLLSNQYFHYNLLRRFSELERKPPGEASSSVNKLLCFIRGKNVSLWFCSSYSPWPLFMMLSTLFFLSSARILSESITCLNCLYNSPWYVVSVLVGVLWESRPHQGSCFCFCSRTRILLLKNQQSKLNPQRFCHSSLIGGYLIPTTTWHKDSVFKPQLVRPGR